MGVETQKRADASADDNARHVNLAAVSVERIEEPEAVFRARGVSKVYRMGEVEVHALRSFHSSSARRSPSFWRPS
jgi:hypothetical protein